MGGGGATVLKELIEGDRKRLGQWATSIGFFAMTHADDAFEQPERFFERLGISSAARPCISGDGVRDWSMKTNLAVLFPYSEGFDLWNDLPSTPSWSWLRDLRSVLWARSTFGGGTYRSSGRPWYEYHQFPSARARVQLSITFAFVATHNHFALDRGGKVFKQSAPLIKLPSTASSDKHLALLELLNSSTACFWMKQIFHNKGSTVDDKGARQRTAPFEDFYEFTGTGLQQFPLATDAPVDLARKLDISSNIFAESLPSVVCARGTPGRAALDAARVIADTNRGSMIALQEELDWRCYRLYGLHGDPPNHPAPPTLRLGERAFEIAMARQMAAGTLETTWFTRHGSAPIVTPPAHWPDDYRQVVEQRIALIETHPNIGLIERPEFKRRWTMEPWEEMEQAALRAWLLDRMEIPSIWTAGDVRLFSTNQLTDLLRRDADFLEVAGLYAGRSDVNLETLVAELVAKESVPFLATLRYAETGLRKRARWEATWAKQRREDAIDVEVAARRDAFCAQAERRALEQWCAVNPRRPGEEPEPYAIRMQAGTAEAVEQQIDQLIAEEQRRRKSEEVGDIPVPPKYVTKDFQTSDFWRLRGGLDVPKERFVSFPYCQRDADGSLVVTWAGHNYLKRTLAIAAYYQERKDNDGWPAERLVPLLAGVIELVPWLLQWHNEYDPDLGARMGDYFVDFVQTEARALGLTEAAVAAWAPPATPRRGRSRRAA